MQEARHGSIAVIHPNGFLTSKTDRDELEQTLERLFATGNRQLIINMASVKHLNSLVFGVMLAAHQRYVRGGGRFVLCAIDHHIENIFIITKLTLVFNIYPTEEIALASFAPPSIG